MARVRSPRTTVFKLLENAQQPVFVINGDREIVFANQACGRWIGCDPEEMIGVKAEYHTGLGEKSVRNRVAVLCPPPDLLRGERQAASIDVQPIGESKVARVNFYGLSENNSIGMEGDAETASAKPPQADLFRGVIAIVVAACSDQTQDDLPTLASENARRLHLELQKLSTVDPDKLNRDLAVGQGSWVTQVNQQIQIAASCHSNILIAGKPGSGGRELAEKIHAMMRQTGEQAGSSKWLSQLIPIDCPRLEPQSLQRTITETIDQVRSLDRNSMPCFLMIDSDQLDANAQAEMSGLIRLSSLQFRLLSLSNDDKQTLIESEHFDTNLARELGPLEISIPPLVARREDIALLAQMYLEEHNAGSDKQLAGFTTEALDELAAYHWPRNVEQLEQFVHESCDQAAGDFVTADELPRQIRFAVGAATYPTEEIDRIELDAFLAQIETELIDRAIKQADGNKTRAAELLGITRARLHRRLEGN